MKKLGKKLVSSQETIEAYCDCSCNCGCYPGPGVYDGAAYNSGLGSGRSTSNSSGKL